MRRAYWTSCAVGVAVGIGVVMVAVFVASQEEPTLEDEARACLTKDGHHPLLVAYANVLVGFDITFDETHLIIPLYDQWRARIRMTFSHPGRQAMKMHGELDVPTCLVRITYPVQFEDPAETCRYLNEMRDYGPCAIDETNSCRCYPGR